MENNPIPQKTIRVAEPGDTVLLADLAARAFTGAFSKVNTPQDMATYLVDSFSPQKLAAELALPGSLFLILEADLEPVGYARLLAGSSETCITGARRVELVRFYLLQAWTGQRLGDLLMQACIDQARGGGADVIWLGVWQENSRAIAFYQRWGFVEVGTQTFLLGQDIQSDYIMARRLG